MRTRIVIDFKDGSAERMVDLSAMPQAGHIIGVILSISDGDEHFPHGGDLDLGLRVMWDPILTIEADGTETWTLEVKDPDELIDDVYGMDTIRKWFLQNGWTMETLVEA